MYNIKLRDMLVAEFGEHIANNIAQFFSQEEVLQQMHMAIEDALVRLRDSRVATIGPANGFVIREKDGTPSEILRFGTRDGLRYIISFLKENNVQKVT